MDLDGTHSHPVCRPLSRIWRRVFVTDVYDMHQALTPARLLYGVASRICCTKSVSCYKSGQEKWSISPHAKHLPAYATIQPFPSKNGHRLIRSGLEWQRSQGVRLVVNDTIAFPPKNEGLGVDSVNKELRLERAGARAPTDYISVRSCCQTGMRNKGPARFCFNLSFFLAILQIGQNGIAMLSRLLGESARTYVGYLLRRCPRYRNASRGGRQLEQG